MSQTVTLRLFVTLISLAVFIADVLTSVGYIGWIAYSVPLFFASRIVPGRYFFVFPAAYTLLIIVGAFASSVGAGAAVAVTNRILGISVLWAISFLLVQRRKAEERLEQAYAGLERRVEERTAELSRLTRSLKEERTFLETVLMNIPAGVIIAEAPSGKLILGNKQLEQILRHPFLEAAAIGEYGEYHGLHLDGRPYEPEEWPLARSLLHGETVTAEEIRLLRADGTYGAISVSSAPIRDSDDRIVAGVGILDDISERRKAEEALRLSESRFRSLFEQSPISMHILSPDGRTLDVNRAWESLWGAMRSEIRDYELLQDKQLTAKGIVPYLKKGFAGEPTEIPVTFYDPAETGLRGRPRWVKSFIYPIKDEAGVIRQVVLMHEDVTSLMTAEQALKESEESYRVIADTAHDAIVTIDEKSRITFANPATGKLFGYSSAGLLGKSLTLLMPRPYRERHLNAVKEYIATGKRHVSWGGVEIPGLHRDGHEIPLEISYGEFIKGGRYFFTGILRDITERKKAEETIQYQAYHSLLTGLPNRALLVIYLERGLAHARRNNQKLAVAFLDLDRFKSINDTLGHVTGDRLIKEVAERLCTAVSDSDTVAHVGADEFILVLGDIERPEDVVAGMDRVMATLRKPFYIDEQAVYLTASIGISVYPEDGANPETLLMNADVAMTHAKEQGKDNYQFFNTALNVRTVERLFFENSLRQTLERGQLLLFYQPVANIETKEITRVETLVRWQHPEMGILNPTLFIPVAEEMGLSIPIDEWVLRNACRQGKAWETKRHPGVCITVNLSARQFLRPDLAERVSEILAETGFEPRNLDIEITESTAIKDIDIALANLGKLNKMGIRLSIDDFGTGYSSLTYLKRFPVQTLKIDQSFIRDVAFDPNDQAIVKAVIALGHHLRLRIVAEGVETEGQVSFLQSSQCDEMQGYLFSKPLPPTDIDKLLAARTQ